MTNDDIAKRLIDFGFHAPTMSFPVAGTLMVEPTESEDKAELDRFVEAMVDHPRGDREGRHGRVRPHRQPAAQRAAHAGDAGGGVGAARTRGRRRSTRSAGLQGRSYLSPVRRIDQAYGDRNLVCACPPPEAFAEHDFTPHAPSGNGSVPARARRGAGRPGDDGRRGGRPGLRRPHGVGAAWQGARMTDTARKADLQRYLQPGRDALLWKLEGLSEYDVRRPMTPTGTNLLGLVKHLAYVEMGYFGAAFGRPVDRRRGPGSRTTASPTGTCGPPPTESREDVVALYRRAWAHADATIEALPLEAAGRVPWWQPATAAR